MRDTAYVQAGESFSTSSGKTPDKLTFEENRVKNPFHLNQFILPGT